MTARRMGNLSRSGTSNEAEFITDQSPVMSRRALLQYGGILSAAAGSAWLLSACDVAGDPGSGAADEERLSVRATFDIQNLDPAFLPNPNDAAVMLCVGENLMTFRGNSTELVPELAAEFTSSEDGLSHKFRLKEGIQFHGGYGEVTAEDVKFSFERIAGLTDPPIKSAYRSYWATLEEVQVTGKYTGVIRLKEPFAPLRTAVIPGYVGTIISRAAYEELGKDFSTHPIGTGPYEFVHWQRGKEVLLRKFDKWGGASLDWAGKEPVWKEIVFLPIKENSPARIAVETGKVDFSEIAYTDVDSMSADERFEVTKQPTHGYAWVGFNVTDEKLSDVRVRRAIRQALDVDAMITAAFDGNATRAYAMLAPGMIGYWRDAPKYERDVGKAKDLLADAGINGLALEMTIGEEDAGAHAIAEIVQANLKDIGIDVSIRATSGAEMYEDVGSLQMFFATWGVALDDPMAVTDWLTSEKVGGWNMYSLSNKEYDSLNAAAKMELDEDRRHRMYVRMQEIMDEEAVATWIANTPVYYAHPTRLTPSLNAGTYGLYRAWDFRAEEA